MLPYLFLLLISTITPLMLYRPVRVITESEYNDIVQKRNKTTIMLFFIGLFLLLALRDITVGSDLITYKSIFERCGNLSFDQLHYLPWEIGYTSFNKLVSLFFKDYRIFLIITALITLIPIYKLYSRESKYSALLILLFINMPCFLMIFSGLRQAISISIGILAYMLIEKKELIGGLLLVLIAACFHISAFVLLLLYPTFFVKIKSKHLIYIAPMLIAIYIFRVPIFSFLLKFMPSSYILFYGKIQQTGAFGMMILFLIFTVFSFVVLDEGKMTEKDYFMRNILLVATVFQFFVPVHGLIQRASYYFLIFVPVSLLCVVQAPKKELKSVSNLAIIVMGCFFALYFFYNASFSTDNLLDVFPYTFYWSGRGW